ncbi:MAG: PTS glucose transporter subunit IIA [Acetatifactor sp.]|nr:PTS glucose transporter subunit IIA [Acetatifactor sp.]
MGITLNVWIFSGIIGAAYIMGYLMSRTMGRMLAVENAEAEMTDEGERPASRLRAALLEKTGRVQEAEYSETAAQQERGTLRERTEREPIRERHQDPMRRRYHNRQHREQSRPSGRPFASPVAGQVDVLNNQGRRGVLFTPEENRVYAPASGKIIRLYPRGNEFLLRTDSGVVLRVQAGERDAEMTRDYFRPRVVQNEFVSKGKLLLEYDREALARDGYDTHVSMTVEENEGNYNLSVTGSMWVKNGQDCLWVL